MIINRLFRFDDIIHDDTLETNNYSCWLKQTEVNTVFNLIWLLHALTSRGSTMSTRKTRTKDQMKPLNSGSRMVGDALKTTSKRRQCLFPLISQLLSLVCVLIMLLKAILLLLFGCFISDLLIVKYKKGEQTNI